MAKSNLKKRANEPTYFHDGTYEPKKLRLFNKFSTRYQLPQEQEELDELEEYSKLRKATLLKEQEELDVLEKYSKLRKEALLREQEELDVLEKSSKLRKETLLKEQEELDTLELSSQDSYTDSVKSMELSDDLDEPLVKPKSPTNFVNKTKLKEVLSSILNVELDNKVLVDIIFGNKTVIVGRAKINGTSKQLSHIVPHSLIELIVKSMSNNSAELMIKLQKAVMLFIDLHGYSFTQEELAQKEYKLIAAKSHGSSALSTPSKKNTYSLVNPKSLKAVDISPMKAQKATKLFEDKYPKFVTKAVGELVDIFHDYENADICQILTRFILTLSNKNSLSPVFPREGNTQSCEYRLYTSKIQARTHEGNFEIVTAKEISQKIKSHKKIDGYIRVVKNEGAKVANILKDLKKINDIIDLAQKGEPIDEYEYNDKSLKLANIDKAKNIRFFEKYDTTLTSKNFGEFWPIYVAKKLWEIFDLKALEEEVFVLVKSPGIAPKKALTVYTSAKGVKTKQYCIKDGDDYREELIESVKHKYSKKITFREQELTEDFIIFLAKKVLHHLSVASMAFVNFGTKFKPNSDLEESFLDLVQTDYQMKKTTLSIFTDAINHYKETQFPYVDHDSTVTAESIATLSGATLSDIFEDF